MAERKTSRRAPRRKPQGGTIESEATNPPPNAPTSAEIDAYIAIWAKAVETQMHFNEMSVKSRQLGLTFVAAALGIGIVLLSQDRDYSLPIDIFPFHIDIHVTVLLVLGMLRGAVSFGEDFEENYMKKIFTLNKGMTQAVSHFSRFQDAYVKENKQGIYDYFGETEVTAEDKIRTFYSNTRWFLVIAAALLFLATNIHNWTDSENKNIGKGEDNAIQVAPSSHEN